MNRYFKLMLAVPAILLASCSTTSIERSEGTRLLSSQQVSEKSYELGVRTTAFVGNAMLRVRDYRVETYATDQVQIKSSFYVRRLTDNFVFAAGETYIYLGQVELGEESVGVFQFRDGLGILFDDEGTAQNRIMFTELGSVPAVTFNTNSGPGDVEIITSETVAANQEGQNFEIIYSGIDSDTIRLNYREFTDNNMARQAFFQELSYPASSEEIRFRDIVLRIHEVRADGIEFTVISD